MKKLTFIICILLSCSVHALSLENVLSFEDNNYSLYSSIVYSNGALIISNKKGISAYNFSNKKLTEIIAYEDLAIEFKTAYSDRIGWYLLYYQENNILYVIYNDYYSSDSSGLKGENCVLELKLNENATRLISIKKSELKIDQVVNICIEENELIEGYFYKDLPKTIEYNGNSLIVINEKTYEGLVVAENIRPVFYECWAGNIVLINSFSLNQALQLAVISNGFNSTFYNVPSNFTKQRPIIVSRFFENRTIFEGNGIHFDSGLHFIKWSNDFNKKQIVFFGSNLKTITIDNLQTTFSISPFVVNPKGNLIAYPEKDTKTQQFKQWSVYRIVLDAQLNADKVRIRSTPSTNGKILTSLTNSTPVKLLDYSDKKETINGQEAYWFKVRLANKTEGWVFGAFLASDECKLLPPITKP